MNGCGKRGCPNTALYHVSGARGVYDVCDDDLAWAQKATGVPRTTTLIKVPVAERRGQEVLFDVPTGAGRAVR